MHYVVILEQLEHLLISLCIFQIIPMACVFIFRKMRLPLGALKVYICRWYSGFKGIVLTFWEILLLAFSPELDEEINAAFMS